MTLSLKGYYTQSLPNGSELRIDSREFQVRISPEYYSMSLEQSGALVTNIDATTSDPVFLKTKKILENGSGVDLNTSVSIRIVDDVSGIIVYSGSSFSPNKDPLPLDITKKIGVYRLVIADTSGISGEITFAVES